MVICLHIRSVYVEGRRSQNTTETFYDPPPAEIFPVRTDASSAVEKILNLRLRLEGRDGWRDAEERGEGMGWREKGGGGAQQLAPFFLSLSVVALSVSPI